MKKLIYCGLGLFLLSHCSQKPAAGNGASQQECYQAVISQDTAFLQITVHDGQVNGQLEYRYFAKDRSAGAVSGSWRGDTLIWDYAFMAEGQTSHAQVALLRKGGILFEGTGPVTVADNRVTFADPANLTFGESFIFRKIDCPK